ncbi:chemotaxis protein [Rhizobium sp. G187]|uniref:chemotaxis protein n=1 Tax=Rhizobium sp. G187 TaxID=3451352 RepID=UPI003EE57156
MGEAAFKTSSFSAGASPTELSDYVDRMEAARSLIEKRFLDGGSALLSILDVLNNLIASLDQLNGALDEETARETMAKLTSSMDRLSQQTSIEAGRQEGFQEILRAERALEPHVDLMQETLRYLRTFALTAKITGASIADFAGFAEEILDRIQEGTEQVDDFAGKVLTLGSGLGPAIRKSREIVSSYDEAVPQILRTLSAGAEDLGNYRRLLVERATSVRAVASGIQMKLGAILSSMQVGDITRQRIEHCQSSLQILSDYLVSEPGHALTEAQRQSLILLIRSLVYRQLEHTIEDFDRDTGKIVATVSSFRSELAEIEALSATMSDRASGGNNNAIRQLETGIDSARTAVREVDHVGAEASRLSLDTANIVRQLLEGIGTVRAVRTDIHYIALNTNLRCSRIGEEGKAINVVTAELRHFAGRLDETAEDILAELHSLEAAAQQLVGQMKGEAEDSLDGQLEQVRDNLRAAGDRMDTQLTALNEQSQTALTEINGSLRRLDFNEALGDVLRDCAARMEILEDVVPAEGLTEALDVIGSQIGRLYTMVAERELHAQIMGTELPASSATESGTLSDDDLDDAFF